MILTLQGFMSFSLSLPPPCFSCLITDYHESIYWSNKSLESPLMDCEYSTVYMCVRVSFVLKSLMVRANQTAEIDECMSRACKGGMKTDSFC